VQRLSRESLSMAWREYRGRIFSGSKADFSRKRGAAHLSGTNHFAGAIDNTFLDGL